jgi:ankyrin repeat protein
LAHGADPNAANQKGNTALHFACENADKEKAFDIIALLIQAGGDPNVPNKVDR